MPIWLTLSDEGTLTYFQGRTGPQVARHNIEPSGVIHPEEIIRVLQYSPNCGFAQTSLAVLYSRGIRELNFKKSEITDQWYKKLTEMVSRFVPLALFFFACVSVLWMFAIVSKCAVYIRLCVTSSQCLEFRIGANPLQ